MRDKDHSEWVDDQYEFSQRKSLIQQMEENQDKESVKSGFSIELMKSVFSDLFYGKDIKEPKWVPEHIGKKVFDIEELPYKLEDKILSGYWYTISWNNPNKPQDQPKIDGHRNVMIQTGKGGVQMHIDICRKDGWSDVFISKSIWVYYDGRYININDINVTKKTDETNRRNSQTFSGIEEGREDK